MGSVEVFPGKGGRWSLSHLTESIRKPFLHSRPMGLCCSVLGLVDKVGWRTPRSFCPFFLFVVIPFFFVVIRDDSYSIQHLFPVIPSWIKAMLVLRSCAEISLFAPFELKNWWILFSPSVFLTEKWQPVLAAPPEVRFSRLHMCSLMELLPILLFPVLTVVQKFKCWFVLSMQLSWVDMRVRDRAALEWEYPAIQWDLA